MIAINFSWSTQSWSIPHTARNIQLRTLQTTFDTFDQSQHLLHTLNKSFFALQLHSYLSWNNKEHMPKMLFIFSSSILKWLHKNSPIFDVFFNSLWLWQLSQYNLTKLFQMKFKDNKALLEPSMEKNKWTFWPTLHDMWHVCPASFT